MRDIQKLTAAIQQINDALSTLNRLDSIESDATRQYGRLVIHRDYQSHNDFSADEKAICSSMHAAGKRRAAELGREARTAAIEKARAIIEQYRALLPGLAAAAAIEIGAIARDAK